MLSNRKQRAKERRSRQADLMSGVKNLDVMLGSNSRNAEESNSEDRDTDADFESNRPRPDMVQNRENLMSLLYSNNRENREMMIETNRLINSEVTKRIEVLKSGLNSQIMESVRSAIKKKLLPTSQTTLENQHVSFRCRFGPQIHRTKQDHRT